MGLTARAISHLTSALSLLEQLEDGRRRKDVEESLLTRIRSFPSIALSHGLTPSLAYLAAKSSKIGYEELWNNKLNKDMSKEEASYTLYLYIISLFLKEDLGLLENEGLTDKRMGKLLNLIKELDENPSLLSAVSDMVMEFLVELKKVGEAYLG